MDGPLIRSIVIAGGGVAGWSAAAALARALPNARIDVVDPPDSEPAPADLLCETTSPALAAFHAIIGLDPAEPVRRGCATYKLGTRFIDWSGPGSAYIHGYGEHGSSVAGVPFHQLWAKHRGREQTGPIGDYSLAVAAAARGRWAPPARGAKSILGSYEFALHLDPAAYIDLLRHHAGDRVRRHERAIAAVRRRADGDWIDGVELAGGEALSADLYIDCTGPEARLIGEALGEPWQDWSEVLPCDRALIAAEAADVAAPPLTETLAVPSGWHWRIPLRDRTGRGFVYCSALAPTSESPEDWVSARVLRFASGRRSRQWVGNCLALGDSAMTIDPLEATNLHLIHSAIERMLALLPGRDFAPIELAEFNRLAAEEAEGIRDFLLLHYVTCGRDDTPFWRHMREVPWPDSLRRRVDLFRSRGRLIQIDEETFTKDSWLAVLLGQQVLPERGDPLADRVSDKAALALLEKLRTAVRQTAERMPPHSAALSAA